MQQVREKRRQGRLSNEMIMREPYSLSAELFEIMGKHYEMFFPKLPKQRSKTTVVLAIG